RLCGSWFPPPSTRPRCRWNRAGSALPALAPSPFPRSVCPTRGPLRSSPDRSSLGVYHTGRCSSEGPALTLTPRGGYRPPRTTTEAPTMPDPVPQADTVATDVLAQTPQPCRRHPLATTL